ncbi:MAG: class I SAM-dependent methyltransferase, partial [Betaproteobacteria bacterium]|nr:class I SAM-dependent methyltransferase [Betaproteobacteria bacterium]
MSQHEQFWSERFRAAGDDYLFGTAPTRFLAQHEFLLGVGNSVLSVADGEGRNSVWLAEQGLQVTAVEISPVAVEKA